MSLLQCQILFLLKCYIIGLIGNLAMGPVFMLTLTRSAEEGLLRGVMTALAAALADSLLFFLGFFGLLSLVDEAPYVKVVMFALGGTVLLLFGVRVLRNARFERLQLVARESLTAVFIKTFLFTIINPGTMIYFMGASLSVLRYIDAPPEQVALAGACMVMLGTLTVLLGVCLLAAHIGIKVRRRQLVTISWVTGLLLIVFAIFCYYRLARTILLLYAS